MNRYCDNSKTNLIEDYVDHLLDGLLFAFNPDNSNGEWSSHVTPF